MTPKDCAHWLAHCVLAGALVGIGGGLLRWADDHRAAEAVFQGAAAFAAAEMLFLAALGFAVTATRSKRRRS